MELNINQRIRIIVEESGKSVNSFSSYIGVSQPTLKACIDGNNAPRYDTLQKILIANPMISAEWLMRGEGPMFRSDSSQSIGDISGSTAVGNNVHGSGNNITSHAELAALQQQYLEMLKKRDEQIDRLLGIMEKMGGK